MQILVSNLQDTAQTSSREAGLAQQWHSQAMCNKLGHDLLLVVTWITYNASFKRMIEGFVCLSSYLPSLISTAINLYCIM
jgi:hypothetical protein